MQNPNTGPYIAQPFPGVHPHHSHHGHHHSHHNSHHSIHHNSHHHNTHRHRHFPSYGTTTIHNPKPGFTAQPIPGVHPHHNDRRPHHSHHNSYHHSNPHRNLHSSLPSHHQSNLRSNLQSNHHNTHLLHRHVPSYRTTTIHRPKSKVIINDTCPLCGVGVLEKDWTCLGVLCVILFFPLIILFCINFNEKKCSNCGATFR